MKILDVIVSNSNTEGVLILILILSNKADHFMG